MHESIPGVTIPPPPLGTVIRGREFAFHICARGSGIGGPRGFDKYRYRAVRVIMIED